MSKSLKNEIDQRRGDIPRSRYIARILERHVIHENSENQQLAHNTADFLPFPPITHSGVDAENGQL
jgi:hypothetical protein